MTLSGLEITTSLTLCKGTKGNLYCNYVRIYKMISVLLFKSIKNKGTKGNLECNYVKIYKMISVFLFKSIKRGLVNDTGYQKVKIKGLLYRYIWCSRTK